MNWENPLFEKCVSLWGETSQILMAAEELLEASLALIHALRANKPFDLDQITQAEWDEERDEED